MYRVSASICIYLLICWFLFWFVDFYFEINSHWLHFNWSSLLLKCTTLIGSTLAEMHLWSSCLFDYGFMLIEIELGCWVVLFDYGFMLISCDPALSFFVQLSVKRVVFLSLEMHIKCISLLWVFLKEYMKEYEWVYQRYTNEYDWMYDWRNMNNNNTVTLRMNND